MTEDRRTAIVKKERDKRGRTIRESTHTATVSLFALRAKDTTPFHSEEPNGLTLPSARKKIQSKVVQNSPFWAVLVHLRLNFLPGRRQSEPIELFGVKWSTIFRAKCKNADVRAAMNP